MYDLISSYRCTIYAHLELNNGSVTGHFMICFSIWPKLTLVGTGKTPCKYGPVFAPYSHDWTLYGTNTVQKRVRIYMAFFL